MGIALRDPRRRVSRLGGCWREVSGGFRSAAPSWLGATRKQAGGRPGRPTKQHRQTGCPARKSEVWASRKILVTAPEDTALWVDGAGDQRPLRRPLTRSDRREEAGGGGYAIRSFVLQRPAGVGIDVALGGCHSRKRWSRAPPGSRFPVMSRCSPAQPKVSSFRRRLPRVGRAGLTSRASSSGRRERSTGPMSTNRSRRWRR